MTTTPDVGRRQGADAAPLAKELALRTPRTNMAAEQVVLGVLMLAGPSDEAQRIVESVLKIIEPF